MATISKFGIVQPGQLVGHELSDELLAIARDTPVDDLPVLIGALEAAKAVAWTRIAAPAPAPQEHDELIDVAEAAKRLGISEDYLYRHKDLPFGRHIGRKLLFSARGIERYIRSR